MKFRQHRGSLADSLGTTVELPNTQQALFDHIVEILKPWITVVANTKTVKLTPAPDNRIYGSGWQTNYMVSLDGYGVVGYADVAHVPDFLQPPVIGVGGDLVQDVNRDTLKFAQKPRADMRQIFSDGSNTHRRPTGW